MRRRPRALAPLLALAALTAYAPAASAAGGGGNGGGNFDCPPGPPSVIAQFKNPTEVVSGGGGISCPPPGADAPGHFGTPGGPQGGTQSPPTIGTACHFFFSTPVLFRLNGSTPQLLALEPTWSGGTFTADPLNPTWESTPDNAGWTDVMLWGGADAPVALNNANLYQMASTTDFTYDWTFDGIWTKVGTQVKCVGSGPDSGWGTTCTALTDLQTSCFTPHQPGTPPVGTPQPVGALGLDLNAFLRGQFTGGTITSLPGNRSPGLTNIPTCFYVSGMTVNGRPEDPQQDVVWERIVEGPDVGEGRHVYFVFIIRIRYVQTVWDFGDGTVVPIPQGGSSPEAPPGQCGNVPDQQFLVAHTYQRYSTGDGFHVTVTHQFGVDVTEFWQDSTPPHPHELDFPNVIPPVSVPAQPAPAYVMPVVQEEGVPIGG